ncbi:MAG TPA: hypothetical protein VF659_04275 [Pyrinomonadaceae bacterium]|jgi:hypothetical protein
MKRLSLKPLLLLACVAGAAGAAGAQEPCRLGRAVAPDYGGVMLGMTAEELARMFPGSEELPRVAAAGADASKPYVASLGMLELAIRREQFGDAAELLLTFFGGRLHRIDVRYRRPVPWNDVAQFSEQVSRRLAVPSDAWGAPSSDAEKQSRALDCRGFSVVVRIDRGGPSTLSIVDTAPAPPPTPAPTDGAKDAAPAKAPRGRRGRARGRRGAGRAPAAAGEEKKPFEKESR